MSVHEVLQKVCEYTEQTLKDCDISAGDVSKWRKAYEKLTVGDAQTVEEFAEAVRKSDREKAESNIFDLTDASINTSSEKYVSVKEETPEESTESFERSEYQVRVDLSLHELSKNPVPVSVYCGILGGIGDHLPDSAKLELSLALQKLLRDAARNSEIPDQMVKSLDESLQRLNGIYGQTEGE